MCTLNLACGTLSDMEYDRRIVKGLIGGCVVARHWSGLVARTGPLRSGIVGQAPEHRFLRDTLHTTNYIHT